MLQPDDILAARLLLTRLPQRADEVHDGLAALQSEHGPALVDALEGDLVSVVDVTIVSPEPPAFWPFLTGRLPEIELRAERIPAAELPRGREALRAWLDRRWQAKDEAIEKAVKEAMALPEEERNRKLKQLKAKWHPDKHEVLKEMAGEVSKMINACIDECSQGED